jgi:WD40 repeat protein/tetratricopeptide (TPR) repeat protein
LNEAVWFYARAKQKHGPFSWSQLCRLAADRQFEPQDMVLKQGTPKWLVAGTLPGLFAAPTVPERAPASGSKRGRPLPAVPGYEILDVLGRGGMGVVYQARQLGLNRVVALKMIRGGTYAGSEELARFRAEAEAVARFQHPHIVQIHEVGQHDGLPFFSLEFVDGGSLAQKLAGTPVSPAEAAQLAETLARTMHAAHQSHIVHRDLKPANILLRTKAEIPNPIAEGEVGRLSNFEPKVSDFGVAKELDDDSGQTRTGQILGSPSYMAPEQAAAKAREVGPLTDVYALGAILYEMLTGRPPFKGANARDTLEQVRVQEVVPPSRLQPTVPRDLETICLKCLQKEPQQRYTSALALAEDLRRFRAGEPILARPVGPFERLWRWRQRNRLVANLAAAVAGSLMAAALIATVAAFYSASAARKERMARQDADQNAELERIAKNKAQEETTAKEKALQAEERERARAQQKADESRARLAQVYLVNATRYMYQGDWSGALLWLGEAMRLDHDKPERMEMHRVRMAALLRHCPRPIHVWSHEDPVTAADFNADGNRLLIASGATVRVWDTATGKAITKPLKHTGPVQQATLSPDGRYVLTLCMPEEQGGFAQLKTEMRLWDTERSELVFKPLPPNSFITWAGFSLDGRRLLTVGIGIPDGAAGGVASQSSTARVWDAATGRPMGKPVNLAVTAAAMFSPDGRFVLSVSRPSDRAPGAFEPGMESQVQMWSAETAKEAFPSRKQNGLAQASFSPDGGRFLTVSSDGAQLWDAASGKATTPVMRQLGLTEARFSPNGRQLVTVGGDGVMRIWDASTGRPLPERLAHAKSVTHWAFSPDSGRLVTVDGGVHAWSSTTGRPLASPPKPVVSDSPFAGSGYIIPGHGFQGFVGGGQIGFGGGFGGSFGGDHGQFGGGGVQKAEFSPDGRHLLVMSTDQTARVWDAASGVPSSPPLTHGGPLRLATFSPNGRHMLTVSDDRTVRLWDLTNLPTSCPPLKHAYGVMEAIFSPDASQVLTIGNGEVQVFDAGTGRRVWTRNLGLANVTAGSSALTSFAAYSPDSRRVVTISFDPQGATVHIWDAATGKPITALPKHPLGAIQATFSPDSSRVLTVSGARSGGFGLGGGLGGQASAVRLWDAATGKAVTSPLVHRSSANLAGRPVEYTAVKRAVFSPDGRRVLTVPDPDSLGTGLHECPVELRVWNAGTGKEELKPIRLAGKVTEASFSPDGSRVLTVSELRSGAPGGLGGVGGLVQLEAQVWDSATGKRVARHAADLPLKFSPDGSRIAVLTREAGLASFLLLRDHGEETDEGRPRIFGDMTVLDMATGKPLAPPRRHVESPVFSGDGNRVLTLSDHEARVWDAATGQPVTGSLNHDWPLLHAAFSPDGCRVFTASEDRTVRVWDVATSQPLSPPLRHDWPVFYATFSLDGRRLLTISQDSTVHVWDLSADKRPVEDLLVLVRVCSGSEFHTNGSVLPREPEGFMSDWQAMRSKFPEEFRGASSQLAATWHGRETDASTTGGDWAAVVWHLDRQIAATSKPPWQWLARRAHAHGMLGQWDRAVADYGEALKQRRRDWQLWNQRVQAYTQLGRWKQASDDLAKAGELSEAPLQVWTGLALVRLKLDDRQGYRDACAILLKRFGQPVPDQTIDPRDPFKPRPSYQNTEVTRACVLAPDAVEDLDYVVKYAAPGLCKAACLYRKKQFAQAIEQGKTAWTQLNNTRPEAETGTARCDRASVCFILAMSHQRLDQGKEARHWLDEGLRQIASLEGEKPTFSPSLWREHLETEIWCAEARVLLAAETKKTNY